jgi:hypothetical protein
MPDSFTCPRCGRTSYHPTDIKERYCGACHDWTDPLALYRVAQEVTDGVLGAGSYAEINRGNPNPAVQAVIHD